MEDLTMVTTEDQTPLYSDQGRRCVCGGTIYRYDRRASGVVTTYCYTCHADGLFFPDPIPATAAAMSRAHLED